MAAQAKTKHINVSQEEVDKFNELAHKWWDEESEFKPLHQINPLRLNFIHEKVNLKNKIICFFVKKKERKEKRESSMKQMKVRKETVKKDTVKIMMKSRKKKIVRKLVTNRPLDQYS